MITKTLTTAFVHKKNKPCVLFVQKELKKFMASDSTFFVKESLDWFLKKDQNNKKKSVKKFFYKKRKRVNKKKNYKKILQKIRNKNKNCRRLRKRGRNYNFSLLFFFNKFSEISKIKKKWWIHHPNIRWNPLAGWLDFDKRFKSKKWDKKVIVSEELLFLPWLTQSGKTDSYTRNINFYNFFQHSTLHTKKVVIWKKKYQHWLKIRIKQLEAKFNSNKEQTLTNKLENKVNELNKELFLKTNIYPTLRFWEQSCTDNLFNAYATHMTALVKPAIYNPIEIEDHADTNYLDNAEFMSSLEQSRNGLRALVYFLYPFTRNKKRKADFWMDCRTSWDDENAHIWQTKVIYLSPEECRDKYISRAINEGVYYSFYTVKNNPKKDTSNFKIKFFKELNKISNLQNNMYSLLIEQYNLFFKEKKNAVTEEASLEQKKKEIIKWYQIFLVRKRILQLKFFKVAYTYNIFKKKYYYYIKTQEKLNTKKKKIE